MDGAGPVGPPDLGASLTITFVILALLCVGAFALMRWLGRRGPAGPGLQVVARCSLDARRSIWVVQTSGRAFLLGSGEAGVTLLAELDPHKVEGAGSQGIERRPFADLLGVGRVARDTAGSITSPEGKA
jgi:flagellar biosynthetic protein FliO